LKSSLFTALGLLLLLEGLLPLFFPQTWRDAFKRMVALEDGQLRFVGLMSIIVGLVLLWIAA
jgi:uncharacterized protein YjeT (DUF2065 family)